MEIGLDAVDEKESKIISILSGDRRFEVKSGDLFNKYKEYEVKDTDGKPVQIYAYPKHLESFTDWNINEISLPVEHYPTEYIEAYLELIKKRDEFDVTGSILNKTQFIRETFDAFNIFCNKNPVNFLTFLNRLGDSEMDLLYAKYIAIRLHDPKTLPIELYDFEEENYSSEDE